MWSLSLKYRTFKKYVIFLIKIYLKTDPRRVCTWKKIYQSFRFLYTEGVEESRTQSAKVKWKFQVTHWTYAYSSCHHQWSYQLSSPAVSVQSSIDACRFQCNTNFHFCSQHFTSCFRSKVNVRFRIDFDSNSSRKWAENFEFIMLYYAIMSQRKWRSKFTTFI